MTIAEWLFDAMKKLGEAGVDSPRRDALVLLEDKLEKDRTWVLAHAEHNITPDELKKVNSLVDRRLKREPLAYIRGKAWFYGRFFSVNENVLIPRPESETMIELLKNLPHHKSPVSKVAPWKQQVLDVGTGSGCLAITLALELPGIEVFATDISPEAIVVAKKNAKNHKVRINFLQSDLLKELPSSIFQIPTTIVVNFPYVPEGMDVEPELNTEPRLALFAGEDGMDLYRKFWDQIGDLQNKPKFIITESLETQHSQMSTLAIKSGYCLVKTEGLVQLFKAVGT